MRVVVAKTLKSGAIVFGVVALALVSQLAQGGAVGQAAATGHIIPPGCNPLGNLPCVFDLHPAGEIVVGPTTSGSGQVAVEAVQASVEVYRDKVDIMREPQPGASKAWIAIRHHDSQNKYVLLLKNRQQLQFIVERNGVNYTLATVAYSVALNEDMDVELDANGFTFAAYDLRNGGRTLLFRVTDTVGLIPAGNGDSIDLYTSQGVQACWDELAGQPN